MTKEEIMEMIEDMNNDSVIDAWNERVDDSGYADKEVYSNDSAFFDEVFSSPYDAAFAVANGDWDPSDKYVSFDGHGHVQSFDFWDDDNSPVDTDILADWLIENPDKAAEYDIEEDE